MKKEDFYNTNKDMNNLTTMLIKAKVGERTPVNKANTSTINQ